MAKTRFPDPGTWESKRLLSPSGAMKDGAMIRQWAPWFHGRIN